MDQERVWDLVRQIPYGKTATYGYLARQLGDGMTPHLVRAWRQTTRRRLLFGLFVRFTCKDEASAEAYDRLVAETVEAISANEPGTLVYASHLVEGQPLQRIFYELYRDKAAFEAHDASPHTRHCLDQRDQYLASTEVDWLTLQTAGTLLRGRFAS